MICLSCICVSLVDTPGLLTEALQQLLDDPTFKTKAPTAVDMRRAAVHMLQWCTNTENRAMLQNFTEYLIKD